MDKTTKNKMDKQKRNNSPIKKQHRKSNKKPKKSMIHHDNFRQCHITVHHHE